VGTLSHIATAIGLAAFALGFAAWWLEPALALTDNVKRGWSAAVQRFEAAQEPPPPPVPSAQSRVSRVDNVVPPTPPAAPADSAAPSAERKADAAPGPQPKPSPRQPSATSVPVPFQQPLPPTAPRADATPGPLELRDRRIAGYVQQAQRQQANGDFAGLAKTCQRWADEDWRDARAFYCAGLGLQGIGQHRKAIEMFNRAGALLDRDDPLKFQINDAVIRSFRATGGG
jgi:type IV secretory pathway VirB10-like protein